MASNTPRLGLLKKDPLVDGSDTFNIKTMMNDNWDKIDSKVATLGPDGKVPAEQLNVDTSTLATKKELAAHSTKKATETELGHVKPDGTTITVDENGVISAAEMIASNVKVEDTAGHFKATNVEEALSELFIGASDVKTKVATAITGKGIPASSSDTGQELADKINQIKHVPVGNVHWFKPNDIWFSPFVLPKILFNHVCASVEGKMYVMTGSSREGSTVYSNVTDNLCYDPVTGEWSIKAPVPIGRTSADAVAFEGKIYVLGGTNSSGTRVDCYDPSTDTWTQKAPIPASVYNHASVVLDGKIYVLGGYTSSSSTIRNSNYCYDISTDTWTTLANMPIDRHNLCAATAGGKIYVMGGHSRGSSSPLQIVHAYNIATNTWSEVAPLPISGSSDSAVSVDDKVYYIGKYSSQPEGYPHRSLYLYDYKTNTWTPKADIPAARDNNGATVIDGLIYVTGGNKVYNGISHYLDRVDVYLP
ncbi:kelch repeat-containing protein [Pseudobacillus sp. FSL P4-0506]|uniref:Kelch repeat-containing protein n=1 Tax=Pseudobacillus sp. FSL P4-0506 TaxID=2921576 RepID=UPI0030F5153D